jgi:hypothetical protein
LDAFRTWIDSEIMQQLKGRQSGNPRLALIFIVPVGAPRRKARASRPLAVFALQRQQSVAPALDDRPGPLSEDGRCGRVNKITQHLPADGGIRIKQPFQ